MSSSAVEADRVPLVVEWMRTYLTRGHSELGREGSVCPFVRPALKAGTLMWREAEFDEGCTVADILACMREDIALFGSHAWPEGKEGMSAIVTVLTGIPDHRLPLLDEAQRLVKLEAVRAGAMVGQFHPDCPQSAVWNQAFMVSRSPVPLFVVRSMALHDILFLHGDPLLFAAYEQRFGDRYTGGETHVPDAFAELYRSSRTLGTGSGAYIDYQNIDVLLSLQHPHTTQPAEMTFYLIGQVKELLFKLVYEQVSASRLSLVTDAVDEATWGLRRAAAALELLGRTWDVLRALSPGEFASFRQQLGEASGIDSYMYRMTEFSLGRKSSAMARRFADVPGVGGMVFAALRRSSVHDEALGLLRRRGLLAGAVDGTWDPAAVRQAWASMYRTHGPDSDLFRLAEALMDVAESFGRWQALHLLLVERVIGTQRGTGGTNGVGWLRRSADYRFFPELWEARDHLGDPGAGCPV